MEGGTEYVGIDVSKAELVVAMHPSGASFTLAYSATGLRELSTRLSKVQPALVVVEATGGLQRQVVAALWSGGIQVAVVNPGWVRAFARGRGQLAKTDRIDAQVLALFAEREQPQAHPPLDEETAALQELASRRDQLIAMRVAEQHREQQASAAVRKEVRQHISYLQNRIKQVESDIDKTVRRSQAWKRKSEVLRSFPGVGKVFCMTVLSKLPELGTLVYRGGQPQIGIKQGAPARRDQGRKRPMLSRMRRVHQPGAEPERSREPR